MGIYNVYYEGLLANYGIALLGAFGVYVILKSGQISVGNAGFMAVGAYCASALTVYAGWPIWLAILLGGLAAGVVGAFVGLPALRLRGAFLVIGTIGFCEMMRAVFQISDFFGGASGMRGIARTSPILIFFFVVAAVLMLWLLERTRVGLSLAAVAASDVAASSIGIDVVGAKIASFACGAMFAGVSGGCYAHWVQYIEPEDFSLMVSTMMVLPVVLGGRHRIAGVLLGTAIFTVLPEMLRFAQTWRMVLYGSLVIIVMILRPAGLIGPRIWKRGTPDVHAEG